MVRIEDKCSETEERDVTQDLVDNVLVLASQYDGGVVGDLRILLMRFGEDAVNAAIQRRYFEMDKTDKNIVHITGEGQDRYQELLNAYERPLFDGTFRVKPAGT